MKKKSILLVALIMLSFAFVLTGCGAKKYDLNFWVNGEIYQTVQTPGNETIQLPEEPTKDNFVFGGWYEDENVWSVPFNSTSLSNKALTEDKNVYAKWDAIPNETHIQINGFSTTDNVNYKHKVYNATLTLDLNYYITVSNSFTWFLSYDVSGTQKILGSVVELDVGNNVFYAIFTSNTGSVTTLTFTVRRCPIYIVSFNPNNGDQLITQHVEEGQLITPINNLAKTGYIFSGWDGDTTTEITENTHFNAQWIAENYNITYHLNKGINDAKNPSTYNIESAEITLLDPSKEHYVFAGWYTDSDFVNEITTIYERSHGNMDIYAKWNPYKYYITYITNGGYNNQDNPTWYNIETEKIILKDATKASYDFAGWFQNQELTQQITSINKGSSGNLTLYAKWTPTNYNIIYHLNGGENNEDNPSTYNIESDSIILKAPTKDGYEFVGWYSESTFDNEVQTIEPSTCKDVAIYAKFTALYMVSSSKITGLTEAGKNQTTLCVPSSIDGLTISEITNLQSNNLKHLEVSKGVMIANDSLNGNVALEDLTFDADSVVEAKRIGKIFGLTSYTNAVNINGCYFPENFNKVTITGGAIANSLFTACSNISTVIILDGVTQIGQSAFNNCSGLTEITLPFIGSHADGSGNTHFGYLFGASSFSYNQTYVPTTLKKVTIAGSTSVSSYAFYGCTSLTSVIIEDSVTSIKPAAFYGCSGLKSIIVDENNTVYDSRGNCNAIIETATNSLIVGCPNTIIPNSVTNIGASAFSGCTVLESITIPSSVISIGSYAFSGCAILKTVTFEEGSKLETIGADAFRNNTSLTSITIPSNVTSIFTFAFSGCGNLNTVIFKEDSKLENIYSNAFYGCTSLTGITIPHGVTNIHSYLFSGCTALESIKIPNKVTSIGEQAFYGCTKLASVEILGGVTSIGEKAFYGCTSLTSIIIPSSVTTIYSHAFNECTKLAVVYYGGTEDEWISINKNSDNLNLTNATIYYYSKTEPTKEGNYWRYVFGEPIIWE